MGDSWANHRARLTTASLCGSAALGSRGQHPAPPTSSPMEGLQFVGRLQLEHTSPPPPSPGGGCGKVNHYSKWKCDTCHLLPTHIGPGHLGWAATGQGHGEQLGKAMDHCIPV